MDEELKLTIQASASAEKNSGKAKISGVAYSGGTLSLGWDAPVVVDLAGMTIGDNLPLLAEHWNMIGARLGVITAEIADNKLLINGEILADNEDAKNIIAQGKAGGNWQLSIGADVQARELVKETREVNGQMIEAPFYLVSKSVLREVSVVAVGADAATEMHIAAKFNLNNEGEETMAEKTNADVTASAPVDTTTVVPDIQAERAAAIQAERSRVAEIRKICAGEFADIEAEAIENGLEADAVREKVLTALRAKQPKADVNIIVPSEDFNQKTLEAAFALRAGLSEDAVTKAYGEQTIEAAYASRDISLSGLMTECLRLEGKNVGRSFNNETIQAAFSTVSLPEILNNVANKKLRAAFQAQPVIATKLCSTGDLNDFKENQRLRMTDVGDLVPVAPNGEIKDGGLSEEKAVNQLDTYAKKFVLTRQMIINDDLGAFMKVPVAMGNRAARLIDQLFFKRLLANPTQSDGNALFHATHGNLLTGSTSALSKDSLQSAIGLFLDQVDADNQPISIEPRFLLVPTALKFLALELVRGASLIATGSDNLLRPALNALADENLQVISSPYLANTAYAGASSTAWYLFGDPAQADTFEIGYLKGKRTPTVERGETDFNTLGMWFRVYFDLGIREQDHRGMVKSNGAA